MDDQKINNDLEQNKLILLTLHEAASQLTSVRDELEVYLIIRNVINKIFPGSYFTISRLQADDMNYRVVKSSELNKYIKSAIALTGKDLYEMDFPFENLNDKQIQAIRNRKILHFTDGIYDLVNGKFSRTICKTIEKLLDIEQVFSMSMNVDNRHFGGIALFVTGKDLKSGHWNDMSELVIETIAHQASSVIQRLRDRASLEKYKEILILTNLQLETLIENSSSGYLFEDESRKILKVNKAFLDIFDLTDKELILGLDCRKACLSFSGLFTQSEKFANEVEKYFKNNRSVFNEELTMKSGRVLERDFIPVKTDSIAGFLWQYRDITERKKIETELQISQTRFNQLISQLNDIVWKADGDGSNVIDLNNSFEKIYGIPASEFKRNPNLWMEVVHPEDREIAEACASRLFETGNASAEYRILRPDGKIIWVHDRTSIVFDKNGTPIQMGGITTNITDRKLLEESLLMKDFALEASPTAISLADLDGTIFYANKAYLKLWGYKKKSEVIGKHVSDISVFKEEVARDLELIKQGHKLLNERVTRRKDGTDVICMISASLVKSPEGKPICLMALFFDTTEQKQIEFKLQNQAEQLKELNQTKDKFFSILAHDLKSPFNSIIGFAELLENEYYDLTDDQRVSYISILFLSINSTYKLLENLLDWSRLQQGRVEIKPESLELRKLVSESIEPYLSSALKKGIIVSNNIPDSVIILADNYSLQTVIRNLFINAIKYTSEKGQVRISSEENGNFIEVSIRDNGKGMSATKISKLFRIEESHSTPGTNGELGTGLGLIICKDLINKNNGSIWAESEVGKGSVFTFSLPAEITDTNI